MNAIVKKFLNAIKCPVCKGQIDIFDGRRASPGRRFNFACATNYEHYAIYLNTDNAPFFEIEEEYASVKDNKYKYEIVQYHSLLLKAHQTNILIFDINGDGNVIEGNAIKDFSYNKALFDLQKTSTKKLLNRIKTILVFQ